MTTTQPWLRAELISHPETTIPGAQLMIPAEGVEFHDDQLVFHNQGEVVHVVPQTQIRSITWSPKQPNPALARRKTLWPNHGTRWTDEEREQLRTHLQQGHTWRAISTAHGRSRTGCQQEAVKQGWLDPDTLKPRPELLGEPAQSAESPPPTLDQQPAPDQNPTAATALTPAVHNPIPAAASPTPGPITTTHPDTTTALPDSVAVTTTAPAATASPVSAGSLSSDPLDTPAPPSTDPTASAAPPPPGPPAATAWPATDADAATDLYARFSTTAHHTGTTAAPLTQAAPNATATVPNAAAGISALAQATAGTTVAAVSPTAAPDDRSAPSVPDVLTTGAAVPASTGVPHGSAASQLMAQADSAPPDPDKPKPSSRDSPPTRPRIPRQRAEPEELPDSDPGAEANPGSGSRFFNRAQSSLARVTLSAYMNPPKGKPAAPTGAT